MRIRTWICGVLLSIAAGTPALAWDYQGHEMVGAIADQLLTDNAKQKVQENLNFTLQVAAPWPDCVRSVVHKDDGTFTYLPDYLHPEYRTPCEPFETKLGSPEISPEQRRMEDYAKRNWYNCTYIVGKAGGCHQAFHFADVAIQRDGYDRRYVGTNDHDVASAINACIAVLQDRPTAPAPFSIKDKKEALFLLAHFMGDIHQPLHVGAIYLDSNGTPVDPDATGLDPDSETQGGNAINDAERGLNLHSEWDKIPEAWGLAPDAAMLAVARAVSPAPGPINGWAASWASDTVKEAQAAFAGLSFSSAPNHRWDVHFGNRETYDQTADKIKRAQLAKGGARLAQILNAIFH